MLIKLFKHEMRATAKTFMWLYIAFAAISIVSALVGPWSPMFMGTNIYSSSSASVSVQPNAIPSAVQVIVISLYFLAAVAIGIVTLVVIILRFYRNLLGDEGYLMMTLPASREEHILSKLLAAIIWSMCSMVLIILSILLFIAVSGHFGEVIKAINESILAGMPVGRWIFQVVLMMIISTLSGILMLYASMAIGPNLLRNRVGGSILAFIIISVAGQFISGGVMLSWARPFVSFGVFDPTVTVQTPMGNSPVLDSVIDTVTGMSIISCVIIGVACWLLTQYMLRKKLNLA